MVRDVQAVETPSDFRLAVVLVDGRRGPSDLRPFMDRPGLQRLRDPGYFARVGIRLGALTWPAGLVRTHVAGFGLGGVGGQPILERRILSCLPARTSGSECTKDIRIEANGNLLFGGPRVRAARSAGCCHRCGQAATGRNYSFEPGGLGLACRLPGGRSLRSRAPP